jgi:hypothetical protein
MAQPERSAARRHGQSAARAGKVPLWVAGSAAAASAGPRRGRRARDARPSHTRGVRSSTASQH